MDAQGTSSNMITTGLERHMHQWDAVDARSGHSAHPAVVDDLCKVKNAEPTEQS